MGSIKKRMLFAVALASLITILYCILYAKQGRTTSAMTNISLSRHATIELYNKAHKDSKNINDFVVDEDIFLDVDITEYVYQFTLSVNSRFFKKNYIYNIYPEFEALPAFIDYAYMAKHGDKYGYFVSKQHLSANDITQYSNTIPIIRTMNDSLSYWFLCALVLIAFLCFLLPLLINKIYNILSIYSRKYSYLSFAPPI